MFMPKKGISVTLRDDNLLWLKTRTVAARKRSLSETLDDLITAARTGGGALDTGGRSVVATIDIAADDPDLLTADAYLRDLVRVSLARPSLVREEPPAYDARPGRRKKSRRG
jgi:hypothetical protein